MGYFTNYDPFTGAPFNRPVFYREYPGEEELVSYHFNGRSYVIDSSVAKSEGIERRLPVSETRPYHWISGQDRCVVESALKISEREE